MLPDYPQIKEKLREFQISRMELVDRMNLGIFSEIPSTRIFEGHKDLIVREDNTIDETEIKRMSAEIDVKLSEIEDQPMELILKKLDAAASDISKQKAEMIIETVNKATEQVGNVVNCKGSPFTIEHFFEAIKKMWIDFDEFENPYLPPVVAGEKAYESMNKVLPLLETDDRVKKEFSEIIEIKKAEWRARESNRKLVD